MNPNLTVFVLYPSHFHQHTDQFFLEDQMQTPSLSVNLTNDSESQGPTHIEGDNKFYLPVSDTLDVHMCLDRLGSTDDWVCQY